MFVKILFVIVALVVILVIVVALRPADFHYHRSTTIAAPPAVVFAQVNELQKWGGWDPWAKKDPNCKTTFEGPPAGVGAAMSWAGNNDVGEGKMTLMASRPSEFLQFKLEFVKPFVGTNTAEFSFKPEGNQTVVTWSMFGKNNFMSKAVGLFMDCEKMVGDDFDKGLTDLKSISETKTKN